MVYNVVPGNVYALSGRHCGPHSPSIKQSIPNWYDRLLLVTSHVGETRGDRSTTQKTNNEGLHHTM